MAGSTDRATLPNGDRSMRGGSARSIRVAPGPYVRTPRACELGARSCGDRTGEGAAFVLAAARSESPRLNPAPIARDPLAMATSAPSGPHGLRVKPARNPRESGIRTLMTYT